MRTDPADTVAEGPAPTAPPGGVGGAASGGSGAEGVAADVNDLIRRVDDLNNETDLCRLLTGRALQDLLTANVNLTSLLTNPAGFSQLFASLDRLFAHMSAIGPPELAGPLQTMQGVWRSMSGIDPRSPDAETRSKKLLDDPAVQQARDAVGAYASSGCKR